MAKVTTKTIFCSLGRNRLCWRGLYVTRPDQSQTDGFVSQARGSPAEEKRTNLCLILALFFSAIKVIATNSALVGSMQQFQGICYVLTAAVFVKGMIKLVLFCLFSAVQLIPIYFQADQRVPPKPTPICASSSTAQPQTPGARIARRGTLQKKNVVVWSCALTSRPVLFNRPPVPMHGSVFDEFDRPLTIERTEFTG